MNPSPIIKLCNAVESKDYETAREIITAHPDVLAKDGTLQSDDGDNKPYQELEIGDSPLMRAVNSGDADMARLLLENGADPDEHHGYNYGMPAQAAMWQGNLALVNLLLDFGADPARSSAMADMELTGYGLFCGDTTLINRIYDAGGRADIYAYIKANMLPVLGELLDHCPDVPAQNPSVAGTRTVLEAIRGESCWCGNADALSMALAIRPITAKDLRYHIESLVASHNRLFPVESYLRCINLLFDAAPDNSHDDSDFLPLHRLAQGDPIEGCVDIANLLIERGLDPMKTNPENGKSALEEAKENDRKDMVGLLESLRR